jgi:antimicrobial peptide system SdpA family protein
MKEHLLIAFCRITLTSFWLYFILYVYIGNIKDNPLRFTLTAKKNLIGIVPEGWGFFTRNPREARTAIYVKNKESWEKQSLNNFQYSSIWGLDRKCRTIEMELNVIKKQVFENDWIECSEKEDLQSKQLYIKSIHVKNSIPAGSISGEIILEKYEVAPWAWANDVKKLSSRIVKLYVE